MIILDVPRPTPINRMWRHGRTNRNKLVVYKSKQYKDWLWQFGVEWIRQRPRGYQTITGPFKTTLIIVKGRADNDAYAKAALDAAQKVGIISNDRNNQQTLTVFGTKEEAPLGCRIIFETC